VSDHPRAAPHAPGRSWTRIAFYAATAAILVVALGFAQLPYLRYVPGNPTPLEPLIEISGVETTPIEGETALLTVFLDQVTPLEALLVLADRTQRLTPTTDVAPGGDLSPEFFEAQREQFARQFQVAAAVGAQAAGVQVDLRTSALVVDVLADGPSAGLVRPGDEVVAVDGERITDATQLQAFTRAGERGQTVTLSLVRDDQERDVEVTLETLAPGGPVGVGLLVETVADGLDLPFDIALGSTTIGGPSAGMMTALTVFDLLSEEDLVAGRTVLGTGTISSGGAVGPVGGVTAKIEAAVANGADIVLVPAAQLQDALLAGPPPELEVIGVETFDDVLAALR
jgi:PDZ domain-containing protein